MLSYVTLSCVEHWAVEVVRLRDIISVHNNEAAVSNTVWELNCIQLPSTDHLRTLRHCHQLDTTVSFKAGTDELQQPAFFYLLHRDST